MLDSLRSTCLPAVYKQIAERMQDKIKLAQAEKENDSGEKDGSQVVDKFLASL
jgi:hypothetical protein